MSGRCAVASVCKSMQPAKPFQSNNSNCFCFRFALCTPHFASGLKLAGELDAQSSCWPHKTSFVRIGKRAYGEVFASADSISLIFWKAYCH